MAKVCSNIPSQSCLFKNPTCLKFSPSAPRISCLETNSSFQGVREMRHQVHDEGDFEKSLTPPRKNAIHVKKRKTQNSKSLFTTQTPKLQLFSTNGSYLSLICRLELIFFMSDHLHSSCRKQKILHSLLQFNCRMQIFCRFYTFLWKWDLQLNLFCKIGIFNSLVNGTFSAIRMQISCNFYKFFLQMGSARNIFCRNMQVSCK